MDEQQLAMNARLGARLRHGDDIGELHATSTIPFELRGVAPTDDDCCAIVCCHWRRRSPAMFIEIVPALHLAQAKPRDVPIETVSRAFGAFVTDDVDALVTFAFVDARSRRAVSAPGHPNTLLARGTGCHLRCFDLPFELVRPNRRAAVNRDIAIRRDTLNAGDI